MKCSYVVVNTFHLLDVMAEKLFFYVFMNTLINHTLPMRPLTLNYSVSAVQETPKYHMQQMLHGTCIKFTVRN